MADKSLRAVLVSHTHWDRAWHQPFQVFRLRLVRLIDRLIELLDSDPDFRCFMLDGQVLPVLDYLAVRSERRADLERLVQGDRLQVGPWYVLADEYLVSPEALIRNLMLGQRLARQLGASMNEGYVPDAFGHIGQLPQILQGFGIGSAIFWRGMGDEAEELGNEFWWEAPDGSRVLAVHLRESYASVANLGYAVPMGDASNLDFDIERALDHLRTVIDRLKPYAPSDSILLMNGVDHIEPDRHVPQVIARANQIFTDIEVVHGTPSDHIDHVRETAGDRLPTFAGELNRSRYAFGLQGVYSSRMPLKQANERAQTWLECYAEPFSTWAWLLGDCYPAPFLELAWRTLLENHPHDDICGCSTDAVHRENMVRFDQVEQISRTLARDAARAIVERIDLGAQSGVPFVLFEPTPGPRSSTVEVDLHFEAIDKTSADFYVVDDQGRAVACQFLARSPLFETEVSTYRELQRVRVALCCPDLPPCGYRVYYAQPGPAPELPAVGQPVEVFDCGMENHHLRVSIQADGTLALLDKHTGRQFHDLGYLVDEADDGDEYDFAPCPQPEAVCSKGQPASIELLQAGPLQASYRVSHVLNVPRALTADRQRRSRERLSLPVTTTVTLHQDSRWVEVCTLVENTVCDHRLRVHFPSDIVTEVAHADGHFEVVTRPIDIPPSEGWDQPPVPTRHQRYFVDLSDGRAGLAILNRGLPEYQVLRDGGRNTVAITLLRCVGYLSRGGPDTPMATRPGLAGPPLLTPEAQCLGTHAFEYAIMPHASDWQAVQAQSRAFRAPLFVLRGTDREGYMLTRSDRARYGLVDRVAPDLSGDLPANLSFLRIEPESVMLSAVKKSEHGGELIVRLYNPSRERVQVTLQSFWPILAAQEVAMNEEPVVDLVIVNDRSMALSIAGKQVKTVALQVAALSPRSDERGESGP